jgi:hypothetical protein
VALPSDGRRPKAIERIARDVLADIPEGEQAAKLGILLRKRIQHRVLGFEALTNQRPSMTVVIPL